VETEYGYHIIKVTDHKDAEIVTFDKAKDSIINELTMQKQSTLAQEYVQSLKEKAKSFILRAKLVVTNATL